MLIHAKCLERSLAQSRSSDKWLLEGEWDLLHDVT